MNKHSATVLSPTTQPTQLSEKLLSGSVTTWFIVAVIGQLLFALYVAAFYGGAVAAGNLNRWSEQLTPGYVAGQTMDNVVLAVHLFFAILIMLGGPLQLIPAVRQRAPKFHRWNGRLYVLLTAIGGLSGFYMIWVTQADATEVSHLAMSIESLLIVVAGTMVWRQAVRGKMRQHEQWAVRLFLVASGVWFFRVILMAWILINGSPVGIDPETFTGPFINFVSYAHYLLPLAVYELLLLARRSGPRARYAMSGLMIVCTLLTAIGIFGATVGMWLPAL